MGKIRLAHFGLNAAEMFRIQHRTPVLAIHLDLGKTGRFGLRRHHKDAGIDQIVQRARRQLLILLEGMPIDGNAPTLAAGVLAS